MTSSPEVILQSYLNYLRRNETRKLLPGEGARILKLTYEVIIFIGNSKMSFSAVNVTHTVTYIVNEILSFPTSLTQTNVSIFQWRTLNMSCMRIKLNLFIFIKGNSIYHFLWLKQIMIHFQIILWYFYLLNKFIFFICLSLVFQQNTW